MTRHERLLEEYEDAYFALLMEDVAKKEGERLEALNEMLQNNPEAAVPEELDTRCLETISRHFARRQHRSALRKTGKVLRLIAVIMTITMLLFTTAFAVSEDFRVATLNLMLKVTNEYTQFDIVHDRENETTKTQTSKSQDSFEYFENTEIGWIPEGFEYCGGDHKVFAEFENDAGEFVNITILDGHGSLNIDTENPEKIAEVSINGNPGLCVVKNGYIHVVVTDLTNNLYLEVITSVDLSEDTAEKILENICVF